MEKIKEIFNAWISEKSNEQISIIDKMCAEYNIDPSIWWKTRFLKNIGDWAGADFLDEILDDFIGYIDSEFENTLLKYLPPKGYNIYKEPYLCIDYTLEYKNKKNKFYIDKEGKKEWRKTFKKLTLDQRVELMKEKLFSQIVNQTNLKIYSKKDIRFLKLRSLNECSKHI